MPEAQRTLVKSPPELWALVSDPDCLSKHLEPFGEIRITRVEPETTVAWEGDRARGTVELSGSGWGTKVTLRAEPVEVEQGAALQQPLAAPEELPVEEPPVEEPPVEEPAAEVEEPAPEAEQPATEQPAAVEPVKRPGFFARLFGRKRKVVAEEPVVEEPAAVEPPAAVEEPAVEEPEPAPVQEPTPAASEIRVARMADEEAAEVLDAVLDTLGAAHHRPFSR